MSSVLLLLFSLAAGTAQPASVSVRVNPDPVYVERAGETQRLHCDFQMVNKTNVSMELLQIHMRGYDQSGRLLLWKKLDSNGTRPAIEVLGKRHLEPGKPLTIFNPFFQLDTAVPVIWLRYEFSFGAPGSSPAKVSVEVKPIEYIQKTRLILPLAGARVWAYEGTDYYSHHRRVDLTDSFNRDVLGIRRNSQRYALDLVVLDEKGEAFHGGLAKKENWVGFGFPVVAPAAGVVVAVIGDLPDDIPFDPSRLQKQPTLMIGNHVVIDHGNSEYSLLAHFQQGTLSVKAGERVKQGQVIGKVSRSGMGSTLVHLHYELRNNSDIFDADGLPAHFVGFHRVGSRRSENGSLAPGWIVTSAPRR